MSKKILIVDDEQLNITALTHFLRQDYKLIAATDGASAIIEAEKHTPDLILLDIIMPDMNGYEVLSKLKNSVATMHIPIIFLTGLNNVEDEEKGLSLGAVDYITKPFNEVIVKARIKLHIKMADYVRNIEKLCMLDPLTGLPNRRGFDARIESEWGRSQREKKPLGLIMLDIDNFKTFNDTYGHPQGDSLLQSIGEILNKTLNRASDIAVRWGGEEFCVLLPDTDMQGTVKVAEQIRINVMNNSIPFTNDTCTSVTVSLGANSKIPNTSEVITDFIEEVDKLLYTAKRKGKNVTCTPE